MKVALIHMTMGLKGGLETRMFNYMQAFLDRGDEVTLITSKIDPAVEIPKKVTVKKVNLKLYPKPLRIYFFNLEIPRIADLSSFDFVLSMGRTYVQQYVIAPNTHRAFLKAKNKYFTNPSDWIQIYLDLKTFINARVIYACSGMVRDEIVNLYGVDANKIKVLLPPLNTDLFRRLPEEDKAAIRSKYHFDPGKKHFLFVSTSHFRKGIDLLKQLFALPQNQDKVLLVAGRPLDFDLPNVKSLGFVRDVQELYNVVDFTIHPALYEPYGQIVSESLACGTPVLISDNVGAKEVVDDTCGIVVSDQSVDSWQKTIEEAVNRDFIVAADFAEKWKLSTDAHVAQMMEMADL